jgi:hypothetical protein
MMNDRIGIDFSSSGSVLSKSQLEEQRRKRGQCLSCGQQCFQKKLFKMIPLTLHGFVLEGRCLKCKPLDVNSNDMVLPAVSRAATRQDLERFSRTQSSLRLQGPGVNSSSNLRRKQSPVPTVGSAPEGARTPISNGITSISENDNEEMTYRTSRSADDPIVVDNSRSRETQNSGSVNRVHSMKTEAVRRHDSIEANRSQSMNPNILRSAEPTDSESIGANVRSPIRSVNHGHSLVRPRSRGQSPVPVQSRGQSPSSQPRRVRGQSPGLNSRSLQISGVSALEASNAGFDSVHSAVIGGMAARKVLNDYRRRHGSTEPSSEWEETFPTQINDRGSDDDANAWSLSSKEKVSQSKQSKSLKSDRGRNSDDDDIQLENHDFNPEWNEAPWSKDDDEPSQTLEPSHGILNRGGDFKISKSQKSNRRSHRGTSSVEPSRTTSSISSGDDDSAAVDQKTWKPFAESSVIETFSNLQDDVENISFNSEHQIEDEVESRSSLSSQSGHSNPGLQEQRAVESLSANSTDYTRIISIMSSFPGSTLVQQEGLNHLSNLHLDDDEYDTIVENGALNIVISAMVSHIKSSEVQSSACRAMWNLSATSKNQIRLVNEGALDRLLEAMEKFPGDAELQEKALAAMSNLGASIENQRAFLEKNVLEKVVDAMNRHSEDSPVQCKACSALTNFASYDSPLKRQIMQAGGGGAVVVSMIMHPEDIELQEKALRALRNICANSDENKVELANVGAIDAVITAMQVHRDEPGVQEAGAWTLSNLAVNHDNKAIIGDSGGIDVVIRAMWVHSDNVGVQEWCCRALWTLSVDAQNRQIILEVGGISAVVNAMQAHADASTVQEKGCGVLSNLAATDDDCKIRIVEEEGLDAIIMAMVIHAENRGLQDRACSVIKRLAIGPNIKLMQAANVGELVTQAALRFPEKCQSKAKAILAIL